MLITGSHALVAAGVPWRTPKDKDCICWYSHFETIEKSYGDRVVAKKEVTKGKRRFITLFVQGYDPMEFEIAENDNSAEKLLILRQVVGKDYIGFAEPELVYTMKMTHRYLKNSPHFLKTMRDIQKLRELGYGTIPDYLSDWYKERIKETYYYNHPALNQTKDAFFSDDGLNYIYDHDSIHEAVKMFDKPAFEFIKKDAADVFCSKEKFMEASQAVRDATVLEEAEVLALERHQIPNGFSATARQSFEIALRKVCTSIASGWWREYAWENYDRILELYIQENESYKGNYITKFKNALDNGIIKPYKENTNVLD